MADEIVAESWNHLTDLLFEGAWNDSLRRYRSDYAYRGVGIADRDVCTGLSRLGGDYAGKERHVIRNFRKYARRAFPNDESIWNWLALAQHHGLPTRLIDWSYSPFVAMHFATADLGLMDVAGEIWLVDFRRSNERLPRKLFGLLEAEGSSVFTGEMLAHAAPSLEALGALAEEPFLLFIEPPSLDDRIVNQAALFSIMSSADASLAAWLGGHRDVWRRIVLPAELKWEVRDRLDQMNVTERVLFPGLDGLSAWLRRYYRDRDAPTDAGDRERTERLSPVRTRQD